MISIKKATILSVLLSVSSLFAQQKIDTKKITITGKVIEKTTSLPLEYATVEFRRPGTTQAAYGGVTNNKGEFSIEITPGTYDLKYEFISFKIIEVKGKTFTENTNVGNIYLEDEARQLDAVEVRAEKTTVDIKLDKKVFTVGKDILVRGGTVSDVLDNVPSISVSTEGTVALRGNENVRILIDGKPSNAANVNDALRLISADAIDKVEVVTNPSARYDAEGGGGIINIILKKGKNQGLNGTFIVSAGSPQNTSGSANINLKSEHFNFFSTVGYNKRKNPGYTNIDTQSFKDDGSLRSFTQERRDSKKDGEGTNVNFGMELLLDKNTSWTNAFNYRDNNGENNENVLSHKFDGNLNYINTELRDNDALSKNETVEYTTNFIKKFKKDGHQFSIDGAFSQETEKENAIIEGKVVETSAFVTTATSRKNNKQGRNLIQADYVLPIKEKSRIEAGFRGNYVTLFANYLVQEKNNINDPLTPVSFLTGTLDYVENVNALYAQFGTKINKFSFLTGLRYENSHIEVNLPQSNTFNTKNYENFFPSAFLTYEISNSSSVSLNYSRRISRPRDRFINPFASYTSSVNLFQGNPNINPAMSDAYDIGYLKKWDKLTFNTSLYFNHTTDSFQFVRKASGKLVNGVPEMINTPFNLNTEDRTGFEFTLNYNFKKWWKINTNFNFFEVKTTGDYTYTDVITNELKNIDFNKTATTWSAKLSSKITLPYKIDWQTSANYNAPQKNGQGITKGMAAANLAFSKDVLKDMGTISFNVNDVFNSRKRIQETESPAVISNSEMQWRTRQITVSFTYRFNKKKTDKEVKPRSSDNGDDYIGQ